MTQMPTLPPAPAAKPSFATRVMLLILTTLAGLGLMVSLLANFTLIPRFEKIFMDFNTTLPQPTYAMIALSDFVRSFGWPLVIAVLAGLIALAARGWTGRPQAAFIVGGLVLFLCAIYLALVVIAMHWPFLQLVDSVQKR